MLILDGHLAPPPPSLVWNIKKGEKNKHKEKVLNILGRL